MRVQQFVAAAGLALLAPVAFAQNPGPNPNAGPRLLGNVVSFDGKILMVKTTDGQTTSVAIPVDLRIIARENGDLSAIKAGDFVGSAADEGADGKLHAEEIHIMVGGLAGVGEGHRPMAANAQSASRTMTNATVAAVQPARSMTNATVANVAGTQGRVLTMQYKGGETQIEVASDTPITRMSVSDSTALKPGAAVTAGTTNSDAGLVATQLLVDTDRSTPR